MRRPWFALWVDDFEGDETVKLAGNRVLGAYVRLLCHQWREGSVPADQHKLAQIAREPERDFAAIWPDIAHKFSRHGKRLKNKRMEDERKRVEERSEKAKEAASARWADAEAHANASETQKRVHVKRTTRRNAETMPTETESETEPDIRKDLRISVGISEEDTRASHAAKLLDLKRKAQA